MRTRYNLRTGSSRTSIKSLKRPVNRRQSLRLSPIIKQEKSRMTSPVESTDVPTSTNDDLNDLLARHHRRMLEEQKDRKLYERYVRDQRTLRRLQCRRTHTAHLSETTRTRLLRELERERRYTIHDQICSQLANHLLTFRHGIQSKPMDWSTLEDQFCRRSHSETIRQYDTMINNLKKVSSSNGKSSSSKPRLSVHERKKQRLAATNENPVSNLLIDEKNSSSIEHLSTPTVVRFVTDSHSNVRTLTNSQHLTCIQNVLSSNGRSSSPILRLRPKSSNSLVNESTTKKRTLEKENCSLTTHVLRSSYPNTRKHPMIFTSRRQKRFRSINGND